MPISRRLVAGLTLLTILCALASPADRTVAASCSGNSHALTLSDGGANPGSGTTATRFTFSVTYTDNDGCAPDRIVVVVVGVSTFDLRRVAGGIQSGATYARTVTLPAGRWAYRFEASSGSGAGQRQVKLTKVTPTTVLVSNVTPDPTQQPVATPAPTPRRTAAPTKPPPTHRPSVAPTATAMASASIPTPATTVAPSPAPAFAASPIAPDPGAPIALLKLLVSSIGTVGGLALFVALAGRLLRQSPGVDAPPIPRRRRDDAPTASEPST